MDGSSWPHKKVRHVAYDQFGLADQSFKDRLDFLSSNFGIGEEIAGGRISA